MKDNNKDGDKIIHFTLSSDLNIPLRLKIINLEGKLDFPSVEDDPEIRHTTFYNSYCTDLHVTCSIHAEGKPLTVPVRTCFSSHDFTWNEWLSFPIKISELPISSQVILTIWSVTGPQKKKAVGGTSFKLFGDHSTLRKGRQRLRIWTDREGDDTSTPGKIKTNTKMLNLDKLCKQYERGQMNRVDWLDSLAFEEINRISQGNQKSSEELQMFVELPSFEYKVVFNERERNVKYPTPQNLKERTIVAIHDPDLLTKDDNPIATKHLKLVSSGWRKSVHPDLRPSPVERDRIEKILAYPITKHLSVEDKDLLWKFRFYLTSNPRALTKFLRCVDWTNNQEAKQATELINQWTPIEISDALELLSKHFTSHTVRDYAVSRLEHASDEELLNYLLQLVQALRYDSGKQESKLTKFLIARSVSDARLRNYLYWYLRVECDDPKFQSFYQKKLQQFKNSLSAKDEVGKKVLAQFTQQEEVLTLLSTMYRELRAMKLPRKKKQAKVVEMMQPGGQFALLGQLPWGSMAMPVDPTIEVTGTIPDKMKIFSSSLEPLGVRWKTRDSEYTVIFKCGDDLRQDQVIIQLISLMDQLLKKENLDLKLMPYKVLSTSATIGMVEFVPNSINLATVLERYGNDNQIHNFFREHHPDPNAPYSIDPDVINTFIRSCAGYCVITYILVVGDRHLDNLLLTTEGHLFHIDFGFIGRDPKPYPPPMKLCTEMIAGMGGEESREFNLFKQLCVEAFNNLRKNANLILNLISLMADSSISDIASEKCLLQVQDRFQLEKTDEEAGQSFQKLMTDSVTALFPRLSEKIHKWKQYWENNIN